MRHLKTKMFDYGVFVKSGVLFGGGAENDMSYQQFEGTYGL
jgi:hypothetical protein